jgi:hypothetical protein
MKDFEIKAYGYQMWQTDLSAYEDEVARASSTSEVNSADL